MAEQDNRFVVMPLDKGIEWTGVLEFDPNQQPELRREPLACCPRETLVSRPPMVPQYGRHDWLKDLPAGLSVGVMLVPQGMAYAAVAGLPVVYGLYAALIPQVVYAVMGTSRQLAVGPVAMDSLLVAAGLSTVAVAGSDRYIELALLLALMMGGLQLLLGTFRLGFLAHFISKPVISGFTSAAALIIGLNQLPHLTGIALPRSSQLHRLVGGTWITCSCPPSCWALCPLPCSSA